MADGVRRVRTQAERDADDHTWRAAAHTRPGYATYPNSAPGDPSWWRRGPEPLVETVAGPLTDAVGEVTVTLDNSAGRFTPRDPGRGLSPVARVVAGLDRADRWEEPPPPYWTEREPARRRWWHRLTRRAL